MWDHDIMDIAHLMHCLIAREAAGSVGAGGVCKYLSQKLVLGFLMHGRQKASSVTFSPWCFACVTHPMSMLGTQ
jgi:hypothetical protein